MTDTVQTPLDSVSSLNINRRSVMKAAAWSAPVIAVAISTPLAAASIESSSLGIASGSNLTLNGPNQAGTTFGGTFGGSATLTNRGSAWPINAMSAEYALEGPIENSSKLKFEGAEITGSTVTYQGYMWQVEANLEGYVSLSLLSVPVNVPADGSVTVPVPVLSYEDTLTNSAQWLPLGRRVRATLSISVTSTGTAPLNDGSVKSFPANS